MGDGGSYPLLYAYSLNAKDQSELLFPVAQEKLKSPPCPLCGKQWYFAYHCYFMYKEIKPEEQSMRRRNAGNYRK